ncbi:hypothetical protein BU16DRAFT_554598 [Lophium mytilinum]|uniref:Zn(2)-C6 fungal-type domain-containing protein n=1 Tax=Lophium mytilinum TaxID=390894 RepID=A0A6A6RDA5_9PEZI|nr:hypothetical protein BU16DRAFT_554598 [Lophium mytilinum]
MSHPHNPLSHGKIAIPRLLAPKSSSSGGAASKTSQGDRSRTELACINCRRRKVKCSGDLPKCVYCTKLDILCKYPPPRRDKLHVATSRLEGALSLLEDLRARQSSHDQERIQAILDDAEAEEQLQTSSPPNKRAKLSPPTTDTNALSRLVNDDKRGESMITADAGSNESLDVLEEDLIRDTKSRATGFIGKSSVIQWIRRLKLQIDLKDKGLSTQIPHTFGPPGDDDASSAARVTAGRLRRSAYSDDAQESISQSTYFMDDESVDISVEDPFYLPAPHLAKHLYYCYMSTVHQSFPILSRNEIDLDFNSIFSESAQQNRNSFKMLATLNLVFAIGAKFSYLANGDLHVGEHDHLRYSTKARKLGITESTFIAHPDLERVRILGLLSFYLFSIGQVSRASNTMGLTVRLAYTLGLHVRNEDPVTDVRIKEARVRVWWSLYTLERLICTISGRPSVIADEDCSIFLPVPLDESAMDDDDGMELLQQWFDQHSIGSPHSTLTAQAHPKSIFFRATTQVSVITHKAVRHLYSANTVTKSWEDTQNTMKHLKDELDHWAKNLPQPFTADPFRVGAEFQRETRILTLMYWSAFIIITRPCVCRLDIRILDQTEQSDKFNQYAASLCILAAKQIANLFPKHVDPTFPYKNGPWWFVVHNMMQAVTIFLLELYHRTHHAPGAGEKKDILQHLQKLIRWLKAMGMNDPLAYRGYRLIVAVVQNLAPQLDMTVADMLGVEQEEEAASAAENIFQDMITNAGGIENLFPDPLFEMQSHAGYVQPGFEFPQFTTPFESPGLHPRPFGATSPVFDVQAQFMDPREMQQDFGHMFSNQNQAPGTSATVSEGTQVPSSYFQEYPGFLFQGNQTRQGS